MLSHIHLFCTELEKTVAFWVDGFDARLVEYRNFAGHDGAVLDLGSQPLLYVKTVPCSPYLNEPPRAGYDHVGLMVDNMEEALARLLALPGVRLHKGPKQREKDSIAFVAGPDNVLVELCALNKT
jgi:catechol 2,3-dioxygenase-like lactoylglutathione lyase family enzyme